MTNNPIRAPARRYQGDDVDPTEALLDSLERGVQEALKEIPTRLKAAKFE